MRKIFTLIALAVPPLWLIRFDSRHANAVPTWLMLAACAPLVIAVLVTRFSEQEDEVSDTGRAIGNGLLFLMGLLGMGMGLVGYVMRHEQSLLALLPGWMAPVGALMAVIAVARGLRD